MSSQAGQHKMPEEAFDTDRFDLSSIRLQKPTTVGDGCSDKNRFSAYNNIFGSQT
jgi:hypothetical protein